MQMNLSLRLVLTLAIVAMGLGVRENQGIAQQAPADSSPDAGEAAPGKAKKPKKKRAGTAPVSALVAKPAPTKALEPKTAPTPPSSAPKPAEAPKAEATAKVSAAVRAELLPPLSDSTPPSKIAISSFVVEGDNPPAALVFQLQDGFVLGLVRAGVRVIDFEDLKNKLKNQPDLLGCDTSPCLKQLGQEVGVLYVVRVLVAITGNSFRMSARVFRTTGAAPAALPVETLSRFCDVCTVTEARETMLRLADGIRVPDEPNPNPELAVVAPSSYRPSRKFAMSAVAVGLASIIVGTVTLAASGDRDKGLHALGGAFMGVGAATAVGGIYLYGEAMRPVPPPPKPAPARPSAE